MNNIEKACRALIGADALLIGASNGLSIAEGYHLFANNDMFQQQFGDFQRQYGIKSVLEGCFFDYPDEDARKSFVNRLIQYWIKDYHPSQVMKDLLGVVDDKDYFILTTNADTHLELSGFEPTRVFEMEGTFFQLGRQISFEDKTLRLRNFLARYHNRRLVLLELGVGRNNRLIKQPLMQWAASEPLATYITLNFASELYIPQTIASKSIGLEGDIANTLRQLRERLLSLKS